MLQTLKLRPGIVKDVTDFSNSGGWSNCDKVRFRMGYPETIGGWQKAVATPFLGVCRAIHQWTSLNGTNYTAIGTNLKLYVETGGQLFDITPIRRTAALGNNPFLTQSVSNGKLTVTDAANGVLLNDYVTFSGATAFDNYTAPMLNAEFQVIEVLTANTYTIEVTGVTSAGAGVAGGGAGVTGTYQINTGTDTQGFGYGWGTGTWGRGTWGSAGTGTSLGQLRIWSLDNFGEDLIAAVRGGAIYRWSASVGTGTRAVNIVDLPGSNRAPTVCLGILVSEIDRHLLVFACNEFGSTTQDLMLIRWCDAEDLLEWEPTTTTTAGSERISSGSQIVGWARVRQEVVVWTDIGLNSTAFTGPPFTFGLNLMAESISVIGPNAMTEDKNTLFWMDSNSFRYYDGSVNTIPCPVQSYVFGDLNVSQRFKIFCGANSKFNEIMWFYPSAASDENDRYVGYNYVDNVWFIGSMNRTAWWDVSFSGYPIAAGEFYLWYHEYGVNAGAEAMQSFIEGSDLAIAEGEVFSFISRIIPDISFTGTNQTPLVSYKILRRNFPGQSFTTGYTSTISSDTEEAFVRVRGRQFALRVESSESNQGWRLGSTRFDMQPDGRKA